MNIRARDIDFDGRRIVLQIEGAISGKNQARLKTLFVVGFAHGFRLFSTVTTGLIFPGVGAPQPARLSQFEPVPR